MINVPEFVDGKKLNVAVAKILLENNLKISVAESLTGGEVAAKLVDVAGISKSFIEGIVAYANDNITAFLRSKKYVFAKMEVVSVQICFVSCATACNIVSQIIHI